MRGGSSADWLLANAGVDPAVAGIGAPQRVSQDQGQRLYTGPNLTEYQKQLFLSLQRSTPVVVPTSFQRVTVIGFNLTTADTLALLAPPEIRAFMLIRNDQSSTGNVFVAMDNAASASTAMLTLSPGGYALFDFFVPQNDVHLASSTGTALAVISYANARFNPSNS
jgi:hypothetical protein